MQNQPLFIILMFIFLFTVGLFFMQYFKKSTNTIKHIISALIPITFLSLLLIGCNSNTSHEKTVIDTTETITQASVTEMTEESTEEITSTETTTENISNDNLEYNVINSSEYTRDDKKCINYNVVVNESYTNEQLTSIYNSIIKNDNAYLHTVSFYTQESDIEKIGSYTLAQLEETSKGNVAQITRTNYSIEELEALRQQSNSTTQQLVLEETTTEILSSETISEIITEAAETTIVQKSQVNNSDDEMVYVGNSGNKYHYKDCRTLKGNGHAITLQQAISEGRTSCKVCNR